MTTHIIILLAEVAAFVLLALAVTLPLWST